MTAWVPSLTSSGSVLFALGRYAQGSGLWLAALVAWVLEARR